MSERNTLPQTIFLSHSLLFLIVSSYFPIAGRGLGIVAAVLGAAAVSLAPSGTLLFGCGKFSRREDIAILTMLRCIMFVSVAAFMVSTIASEAQLRMALPKETVCILEGTLVQDSSFSSTGNYMIRLKVSSCGSIHSFRTTASGLATAIGKPPSSKSIVSYGVKVRLIGHFSDELFIFEKLQVLKRNRINDIRESVIEGLEKRLFGNSTPQDSDLLSAMLLLGRSEDYGFPLKELAQRCGCSHVLALSGMHLGILVGICKLLEGIGGTGIKQTTKLMSFLAIGAFVFTAGPRPSLLRAFMMFCLGLFGGTSAMKSAKRRLCATFLIQAMLFPFSMVDLGNCYGYAAVVAIVFLQELSYSPIAVFTGKRILSPFWLSIMVLLFCAPIQIAMTGSWNPIAILLSPIAGLLAAASMTTGLAILVFGRFSALLWASDTIYNLFHSLFSIFANFPQAGWPAYLTMAGMVVLLETTTLIFSKLIKRKSIPLTYDVESMRRKVNETQNSLQYTRQETGGLT